MTPVVQIALVGLTLAAGMVGLLTACVNYNIAKFNAQQAKSHVEALEQENSDEPPTAS